MQKRIIYLVVALLAMNVCVYGQTTFGSRIYKASVMGNMQEWKTVLSEFAAPQSIKEKNTLVELINYQYGYIALCLSSKKKEEAEQYLNSADNNLKLYISRYGEDAPSNAYSAAFTAFRIALNPAKAPFLASKCVKLVHKAVALDAECVQAWIDNGNVYNHMPAIMGGSKEKALKAYQTAFNLMQLKKTYQGQSWQYPLIHATIGKVYAETGQYKQAQLTYRAVLAYEPNYAWVKTYLKPKLDAKMQTIKE